jgi:hypothetical protein
MIERDLGKLKERRLYKAAPVLLAALRTALLEMEFANRAGSKLARKQARAAIIKATGEAPRDPYRQEIIQEARNQENANG